jgi:hypothetical protein
MTPQKEPARPGLAGRAVNNRIKDVQVVNATRTLQALLSTATTLAGLALMLTTHDSTVHLLAACLVANELAKDLGQ